MKKLEYWLFNSAQLKVYLAWCKARLEFAERMVKKYDQLVWDVTDMLEQVDKEDYKFEETLRRMNEDNDESDV